MHLLTTAIRCEFSRAAATRSLSLSCLFTVEVIYGRGRQRQKDGSRLEGGTVTESTLKVLLQERQEPIEIFTFRSSILLCFSAAAS